MTNLAPCVPYDESPERIWTNGGLRGHHCLIIPSPQSPVQVIRRRKRCNVAIIGSISYDVDAQGWIPWINIDARGWVAARIHGYMFHYAAFARIAVEAYWCTHPCTVTE